MLRIFCIEVYDIYDAEHNFPRSCCAGEPTMLFQFVEDDLGMEHVRFGVYCDAALSSPVDEADIDYNLKAWWDFEEGGDLYNRCDRYFYRGIPQLVQN